MHLKEVITGLQNGTSFIRHGKSGDDPCVERLTPVGRSIPRTEFMHSVSIDMGDHGGGGGLAELPINALNNGRFEQDGWEVLPRCICRWKGELVPVNLLADQPEKHRHYAKAKLVGFTNPNGFRCTETKRCTNHFAFDDAGVLRLLDTECRHAERDDLTNGGIWEIVDEWKIDSHYAEDDLTHLVR